MIIMILIIITVLFDDIIIVKIKGQHSLPNVKLLYTYKKYPNNSQPEIKIVYYAFPSINCYHSSIQVMM